jgi:signal transduction histidine kinase
MIYVLDLIAGQLQNVRVWLWIRKLSNTITLDIELASDRKLDLATRQILYRVDQEGLANVARHSGASQVMSRVAYESDTVMLWIKDDGCGFNGNSEYPGLGLESMEERCSVLHGSLTIESQPKTSTKICAQLPFRQVVL